MRRALLFGAALSICAQPVSAQTRIYMTGDVFAEITRFSRGIAPGTLGAPQDTSPRDGVTFGGGGRVGAFFTPAWSLEIGLDAGKRVSDEQTLGIGASSLTVPLPSLRYQFRSSHRFSASSVLVGYHPPSRGRIQAGFRGGVSFMHTKQTLTYPSILTTLVPLPGAGLAPTLPVVSISTAEYQATANGLTATLAAEAAIDLSDHFALVPEMRAHAGGIGGILLRPGVAARWRW